MSHGESILRADGRGGGLFSSMFPTLREMLQGCVSSVFESELGGPAAHRLTQQSCASISRRRVDPIHLSIICLLREQ